jgi:hypothetical protein
MRIVFVDIGLGQIILDEHNWEGEHPIVGEVLELHNGPTTKWTVQEVDWVFEDAAPGANDVPMKLLKVMVMDYDAARSLGGKPLDPMCTCGHKRSMHAPGRCLGDASTCHCEGFKDSKAVDL